MVAEPIWLTVDDIGAIHADQIEVFGGLSGVKDRGLIESAVNAPIHHFLYTGVFDVLTLGIRLCMAIARNHAFLDGDKRTATAAMVEFFYLNGYWLAVPDDNPTRPLLGTVIEQTLIGELDEGQLGDILAPYLMALPD